MIKVGDIIRIRRKDYKILSIFSDPDNPNRLYYAAKTTVSGYYSSFCVLTEDKDGNLYVHS